MNQNDSSNLLFTFLFIILFLSLLFIISTCRGSIDKFGSFQYTISEVGLNSVSTSEGLPYGCIGK